MDNPKTVAKQREIGADLRFVALGGIWLDEICAPGKEALVDVPGGSVAFATFGALVFSSNTPKEIGLIVKAGHDFPVCLEQDFSRWNVNLHILREIERPSARGRILYGESASERTYQRLTQPLPSTPQDLVATDMVSSSCFHLFDVPAEVSFQMDEISTLRAQRGIHHPPVYVWEPQAKSCSPDTLELHKAVAKRVDIFSPNHAELALFFANARTCGAFEKATVEGQARAFLPAELLKPLCILIRCAEHGCFVLSASPDGEQSRWLPAFHPPDSADVIDPTGAGNAFLGGAAVGFLKHRDFFTAAAYGSIAASFAVEVVGLPDVLRCDGEARLNTFMNRLGQPLRASRT